MQLHVHVLKHKLTGTGLLFLHFENWSQKVQKWLQLSPTACLQVLIINRHTAFDLCFENWSWYSLYMYLAFFDQQKSTSKKKKKKKRKKKKKQSIRPSSSCDTADMATFALASVSTSSTEGENASLSNLHSRKWHRHPWFHHNSSQDESVVSSQQASD